MAFSITPDEEPIKSGFNIIPDEKAVMSGFSIVPDVEIEKPGGVLDILAGTARAAAAGVVGGAESYIKEVALGPRLLGTPSPTAEKAAFDVEAFRGGIAPPKPSDWEQIVESTASSLTAMAPGLLSRKGGIRRKFIGGVAAKGQSFSAAEAFDFLNEVRDKAIINGASADELQIIENQNISKALLAGSFEVIGEISSDLIGGYIFGILKNPALSGPVKAGLKQWLWDYVARTGKALGPEVAGELFTATGEYYTRLAAGIAPEGGLEPQLWQTAKVAAGQTALQGILGTAAGRAAIRQREKVVTEIAAKTGLSEDIVRTEISKVEQLTAAYSSNKEKIEAGIESLEEKVKPKAKKVTKKQAAEEARAGEAFVQLMSGVLGGEGYAEGVRGYQGEVPAGGPIREQGPGARGENLQLAEEARREGLPKEAVKQARGEALSEEKMVALRGAIAGVKEGLAGTRVRFLDNSVEDVNIASPFGLNPNEILLASGNLATLGTIKEVISPSGKVIWSRKVEAIAPGTLNLQAEVSQLWDALMATNISKRYQALADEKAKLEPYSPEWTEATQKLDAMSAEWRDQPEHKAWMDKQAELIDQKYPKEVIPKPVEKRLPEGTPTQQLQSYVAIRVLKTEEVFTGTDHAAIIKEHNLNPGLGGKEWKSGYEVGGKFYSSQTLAYAALRKQTAVEKKEPPKPVLPITPPTGPVQQAEGAPSFAKFLEAGFHRFVSEERGKAILEDAEDAGRSPASIASDFYARVYPTLSLEQRGKIDKYFSNLYPDARGMAPLEVLKTDLPPTTGQLEGEERGFIALMEYGNQSAPLVQISNKPVTEPFENPADRAKFELAKKYTIVTAATKLLSGNSASRKAAHRKAQAAVQQGLIAPEVLSNEIVNEMYNVAIQETQKAAKEGKGVDEKVAQDRLGVIEKLGIELKEKLGLVVPKAVEPAMEKGPTPAESAKRVKEAVSEIKKSNWVLYQNIGERLDEGESIEAVVDRYRTQLGDFFLDDEQMPRVVEGIGMKLKAITPLDVLMRRQMSQEEQEGKLYEKLVDEGKTDEEIEQILQERRGVVQGPDDVGLTPIGSEVVKDIVEEAITKPEVEAAPVKETKREKVVRKAKEKRVAVQRVAITETVSEDPTTRIFELADKDGKRIGWIEVTKSPDITQPTEKGIFNIVQSELLGDRKNYDAALKLIKEQNPAIKALKAYREPLLGLEELTREQAAPLTPTAPAVLAVPVPPKSVEIHPMYLDTDTARTQLNLLKGRVKPDSPIETKIMALRAQINNAYHTGGDLGILADQLNRVISQLNEQRSKSYGDRTMSVMEIEDSLQGLGELSSLIGQMASVRGTPKMEMLGLQQIYESLANFVRYVQKRTHQTGRTIYALEHAPLKGTGIHAGIVVGEGAVRIEPRVPDVSLAASYLFGPVGIAEKYGALAGNPLPSKIAGMVVHAVDESRYRTGNDSLEIRRISEGLNKQERQELTSDMKEIETGETIIMKPKLKEKAERIKQLFRSVIEKYKESRIFLLFDSMNSTEQDVMSDMNNGQDVAESVKRHNKENKAYNAQQKAEGSDVRRPLTTYKAIDSYLKRLKEIEEWGWNDYITHAMKGNIAITDEKGAVINVAQTTQQAIDRATAYIDQHPSTNALTIKYDHWNNREAPVKLGKKQAQFLQGMVAKAVNKEVKEIQEGVNVHIAKRALSKVITIKPGFVFSAFTQERKNILPGEEDIFDILPTYVYQMNKKTTLDPVIQFFQNNYHKLGDQPNLRKVLFDQIEAAKGKYWLEDKILDDGLRKLGIFVESKTGIRTGIGEKGFATSRGIGALTALEAKLKFAYRPIAGLINRMSGFGHTWVKTGLPYIIQAKKFLKTEEGQQFMENHAADLGTTLIEESEGKIKIRAKWWQPTYLFQAAEKPNRAESYVASYMWAKDKLDYDAETAREFARRSVWLQQVNYNIAAIPALFRSPLGRAAFQFKTYLMGELHFIASLKNPQEWGKYLTMQFVLGGPKGVLTTIKSLPFLGIFAGIVSAMRGGGDWFDDLETWANSTIPRFWRGMWGFFGMDASMPASFQFPEGFSDLAGIIGSDLIKIYKDVFVPLANGEKYMKWRVLDLSREMIPIWKYWSDLLLSYDKMPGYPGRKGEVWDKKGRYLHSMNPLDFIKEFGGVLPLAQSIRQTSNRMEARLQMRETAQVASIIREVVSRRIFDGDLLTDELLEDLSAYALTGDTIMKAIETATIDPETRNILQVRMPSKIRALEEQGRIQKSLHELGYDTYHFD